jgi:uncharacterized protein YcfJ
MRTPQPEEIFMRKIIHPSGRAFAFGLLLTCVAATTAFSAPAEAHHRHHHRTYAREDHGHCLRFDKTTGTVTGAVAGGLLGNTIAGHHNRTAGTFIGGAAGGLAGHELANNHRKHCR